jgi:hypothetical protein
MKKTLVMTIAIALIGLIYLPFSTLADSVPDQTLHVGYWEGWGNVTLQQAVEAHYNVIVLSFGKVDDTIVSYNEYGPYDNFNNLKEAIKNINSTIKFFRTQTQYSVHAS